MGQSVLCSAATHGCRQLRRTSLVWGVTWDKIFKETKLPGSCFDLQSPSPRALIGEIRRAERSSISAASRGGFAAGTERHVVDAALLSP